MTDLEIAAYVRESGSFGLTDGETATVANRIEALVAEWDEARALLREAREYVQMWVHPPNWTHTEAAHTLARIDAALKEDKG